MTWRLVDEDGLGDDNPWLTWHQQLITHLPGGWVITGSMCNDWRDIFASLPEGSEVREATAEEAETWIERWPPVGPDA